MTNILQSNLSWLFTLFCIFYFPTFGMFVTNNSQIDTLTLYDLKELYTNFEKILETQPEFINLSSNSHKQSAENGIYRLYPYYQKLSPELASTDIKSSRFIIHKHIITGQWQLTEFYTYPWSRNIQAFPVPEENEKDALMKNRSMKEKLKLSEAHNQINNQILSKYEKLNTELESHNNDLKVCEVQLKKKIHSLKCRIEKLIEENEKKLDKQIKETTKIIEKKDKIQDELKSKLIQKENQIREMKKQNLETIKKCELFETKYEKLYKKLEFKNNLTKNIGNNEKIQKELESKLQENENEICNLYKIRNDLESKLCQKENDFEKQKEIFDFKILQNKNDLQKIQEKKNYQIFDLIQLKQNTSKNLKECQEQLKLFQANNEVNNQIFSKYQKINIGLESENNELKNSRVYLDKTIRHKYESQIKEIVKSTEFENINILAKKSITSNLFETKHLEKALLKLKHVHTEKLVILESHNKTTKLDEHQKTYILENKTITQNNIEKKHLEKISMILNEEIEELQQQPEIEILNKKQSQFDEYDQSKTNDKTNILKKDYVTQFRKIIEKEETEYADLHVRELQSVDKNKKIENYNKKEILTIKSIAQKPAEIKQQEKMKKTIALKTKSSLEIIKQVLYEQMPTYNNKQCSYDAFAIKKIEYESYVSVILEELEKNADEQLIYLISLNCKSFLDTKLKTNQDYQYEFMLMHHAATVHALNTIEDEKENLRSFMLAKCDQEVQEKYIAFMETIRKRHENILDTMMESCKNEKIKTKMKCIKAKRSLLNLQQYQYESFICLIGITVYAIADTFQNL